MSSPRELSNALIAEVPTVPITPVPPTAAVPNGTARPAVDAAIDTALHGRICAVLAVAGWGKTSAVRGWARTRRTARIAVTRREADRDQLAAAVFTGLAAHTGTRTRPPAEHLAHWLDEHLRDDVVLVLDDLHRLPADSAGAHLVEELCWLLPDRLSLVLLSRTTLPIDQHRLHTNGLLAELGAPELALDAAEVAAAARAVLGAHPPELAAQVHAATAGWPAAVRHALVAARKAAPVDRFQAVARFAEQGSPFHEFVTTQVLAGQPQPTTDLLALAHHDAEQPQVVELTRRGLLWQPRGAGTAVRVVPPLAVHRPTTRPVTGAATVAATAATAAVLRDLIAFGERRRCAELLLEHGDHLVDGGHAEVVLDALRLPARCLDDPGLPQVVGNALRVCGHFAAAKIWFGRAMSEASTPGADLDPGLAWRLCALALDQGEFREVLALADRTRFAAVDSPDELRVLFLAAMAHRMLGDAGAARLCTERLVQAGERCPSTVAEVLVRQALAVQCTVDADPRQAEVHSAAALSAAHQSGDVQQTVRIRMARAARLLEQGSPRAAVTEAATVLRLARRHGMSFCAAIAQTTLGRAQLRFGELDQAATDLTEAAEVLQRLGSRYLAWPLCGLGDLHRLRGHLVRARAVYEEALALVEPAPDAVGLGAALVGLARTRAVDDPAVAREYAARAVGLGEGLRMVSAHLARGWIALLDGDRAGAAADAALATATARRRHDLTGLAEAIGLGVLAAPDPTADATLLGEAIDIWRESGCRPEAAAAGLLAASVGAAVPGSSPDESVALLRECGLDPGVRRGAGPMDAVFAAPPSVAIYALGGFRVTRNGVPVPPTAWRSRKARDLLKILIARGGPTPREQLMELLWPDTEPARSGNRLSVLLSAVRDVLQPDQDGRQPLITDGSTVCIDPALVTVDVDRFRDAATGALTAHRAGHPDADRLLVAAAEGYTGDFLQDDPYADWAQARTDDLRAMHQAVLRALVGAARAADDVDAVVRHTLRLLADDPYDEQAHLELVEVLLVAGRYGHAQRRYQVYARNMTEFGLTPQPMPKFPPSR